MTEFATSAAPFLAAAWQFLSACITVCALILGCALPLLLLAAGAWKLAELCGARFAATPARRAIRSR
jgi:hypothetical protein